MTYPSDGSGGKETVTNSQNEHEGNDNKPSLLCRVNHAKAPWSQLSQKQWRNHIKAFFLIWKRSPDRDNYGGGGFFHYFALFVMIQELKPKVIVESGAFHGVGTWILRQTAGPEAKIIVLTPQEKEEIPHVDNGQNSLYLTGEKFVDFSDTTREQWEDWVGGIDNLAHTLLFFDDHQAGLKRLLKGRQLGFKHFAFDDNYPPTFGDSTALKQICSGIELWKYFGSTDIIYRDDFNGQIKSLSPLEFEAYQSQFWQNIAVYAEFPPAWDGPSRFPELNATILPKIREPPIFTRTELLELGLDEKFLPWDKESSRYTFVLYAQAKE